MLIDKIALLYLRDGKILSFRSRGKDIYYNPEGKEKAQKQICRYWRDIAILEDTVKLKHRHIIIRKESQCG